MTIHTIETAHDCAPVVLLHASASNPTQWSATIDDLSARFDVVAPHLPGYSSDALARLEDVEGMSSTAIPLMAEILKHDQPVHLVGHSFGGAVALKVALLRPDLVKSLTLYEPAVFSILKDGHAAEAQHYDGLCQIGRTLVMATRVGQAAAGMKAFIDFWNGNGAWDRMPEHAQNKYCALAHTVAHDWQSVSRETWSREQLANLTVPTLVMSGMSSQNVAQRSSIALAAKISSAQLAMLPELDHMAPVTASHWVTPRISDHIARTERSAARFISFDEIAA